MPFFEQGNVIFGADADWYQPLHSREYRIANPKAKKEPEEKERTRFSTEVSKMGDRPALSFVPFSTMEDWAKYNSPNEKSPGAHVRKFVPLGNKEKLKLERFPGSCYGHYGCLRRPSIAQEGPVKGNCSFRNPNCAAAWDAGEECAHGMSRDKLLLSCTHCYAKRGNYQSGLAGWAKAMANWIEYLMHPAEFKQAIVDAFEPGGCLYRWRIKTTRDEPPRFRWFVAGDCPDTGFFEFACDLARMLPDIQFWFPSQRWDLIYPALVGKRTNPIPDNMVVRISGEYMDKHPLDIEHMERYVSQDREKVKEMMDVIPNLTTSVVSTEYVLKKWKQDYVDPSGNTYATRQCKVDSGGKCGKCANCFFSAVKTIVYPYIGSQQVDFGWLSVLGNLRRRKNIDMKPIWARSEAQRAYSIKGAYYDKLYDLGVMSEKYKTSPSATLKEKIEAAQRALPRLVSEEKKKLHTLKPQIDGLRQEITEWKKILQQTKNKVEADSIRDRILVLQAQLKRMQAWVMHYTPLHIKLEQEKQKKQKGKKQ